ncbi:hypothetical protein BGZ83_009210 [Gryganskiella cystojenkinii]|nr:hypothetical protein BGZ83_009210 [Gryganskiella cystojenkinii]
MAKAKKAAAVAATASDAAPTAGSSSGASGTNASGKNTTSKASSSKPKKPNAIDSLRTVVPSIFQESQKTAANHRKNSVMLRKIQEQCAEIAQDRGEEAFNKEFIRNLNVVLAVKKKDPVADRVIQFVTAFILHTREKDIVAEAGDAGAAEGISSRFVENLMHHLLKGVRVKEKLVRIRCCQLIALSTNSLGAMDDDLYEQLKSSLMERVKDKEAGVRVQAVFALSKLQGGDEESGDDEDNVILKLVDMMQHDASSDVRRSALFNLEHTKETLPLILERARDVDPYNRRSVFAKPMDDLGDFRKLSIGDRERLLRYGLSDRDEGVKKACAKMVATKWIQQADDNLIEFLQRLDVMGSDVADDVLRAFFDYRADIIGNFEFNDVFWFNLTVESALLVRAYAEFCRSRDDDLQFEKAVPEVTRHAYYIQKYSNMMQEAEEENRPEAEFIVTQLLMIAKLLDYADENGRRKMFNLLREMLMLDDIPDKHLDCIVETMGKISLNEKDFTRIVIEIISDIRAGIEEQEFLRNPEASDDDDDSPDDQTLDLTDTPRKRKRSISRRRSSAATEEVGAASELDAMLIRVRCLTITKFMLERSTEPLKENSYMYGLLNELVIPALGRQEEVMQELGLHCLGLICVLDQSLAQSNMELFLTCMFAENASSKLHALSLKIVFDLILTFGMKHMSTHISEERIISDLTKVLRESTPELQAIAAEGVAKLMLTKLLKNSENQVTLSEVIVPILIHLLDLYNDSKSVMPTPILMAQQLLDWCDPRRVIGADTEKEINNIDNGLHTDVAIYLVKAMFTASLETRKYLPGILFKIRLDGDSGEIRLKKLTLLLGNLKHKRPFTELSAKKYIQSVEKNILKMFDDAPEALDDDELKKLEALTEEVTFLDEIKDPEDVEEVIVMPRTAREKSTRVVGAKLAKMLKEVDAMLESSESEKGEAEDEVDEESDSDFHAEEDD